jgi:hypothetical protein
MEQQNAFEYFDSVNKFASENQSNKTQQTAVGWIEHKIQSDMNFMEIMGLIRQAKAMEREQIMNAHNHGEYNSQFMDALDDTNGIEYYNETYNK